MESLRESPGLWLLIVLIVFNIIGYSYLYLTSPLHDLSLEARADVDEFYNELAELKTGDLVNMVVVEERPNNVTFKSTETFAVVSVDPTHDYAYLEGPGPHSRSWDKRLTELKYAGPKNLYNAYNRVTAVVHQDDPSYEQLASWYYLQ